MKQGIVTIIFSIWLCATGGIGVEKAKYIRSKPDFLKENKEWVDRTFESLTLDERIGQLFMVAAYSNRGEEHFKELEKLIRDHQIGGLIFFQGGPVRQARMTNLLQTNAKVPMMIGMDAEWGLSMRLDSTLAFPRQMTLGAIRNDSLIFEMGREIGHHFRRMGMHINFAPVADVNNNAVNPVINSRSFGEQRDNVARKAAAYMEGMQAVNVLANAKHFPGHGDTDIDSHKALPSILHSRERLDSIELYPFRQLIARGLSSAMVAHMYIPALDASEKQASTLSRPIVHDLLRKEMGFEGLIITDALNMKGVSAQFEPGTVELKALLAGNDILLFAEDVPKAVRLIKNAIAEGTISEEEINEHCKRILHAKAWAGLNHYQIISEANLTDDLNNPEALALRNQMIRSSLTLISNENETLPVDASGQKKILAIAVGDTDHDQYRQALERYYAVDYQSVASAPNDKVIDQMLTRSAGYDLVLVSVHQTNQRPNRNFGLSSETISMINLLNKSNDVALVHFGNPYALLKLQSLNSLEAVMIAYQDDVSTRDIAAQALFGGVHVNGQLPVSLGDNFPAGKGLEIKPVLLARSLPEEVGVSSAILRRIDSIAKSGIDEMAYPGCQILVSRRGNIIYEKSFGFHTYENIQPVKNTDIYDVASLTKILSSVASLMHLQDAGKFDLDRTLGDYLPYIQEDSPYHPLTLRKVLAHQAGLIPWVPFYTKTMVNGVLRSDIYSDVQSEKYPIRVTEGVFITRNQSDTLMQRILSTRLRTDKEMKESEYAYSDLGYYFVKEIVKEVSGMDLDEYTATHFYEPMGLKTIGYNPRKRFPLERIPPTEYDVYFRKKLIHGDVHDQGAAMQGGVGGHAGVFSSANDVAAMMEMLINGGTYNGQRILNKETIEEYTKCQFCTDEKDKNRRGAGFDKPVMDNKPGPTCNCVTFETFGHTGFTGAMAWADPVEDLVYVFLSNRVYPTAENNKLAKMNIRTDIQEVIYNSLLD